MIKVEYTPLKKIAKLVGGYSFKSSNYVNKGLRVIRISNVQDGYISDEYPCFYPITIEKELGEANLRENDLLMSLTGNVGRVAFLSRELLPAGLNQRVQVIRPFESSSKKYLFYYFRSEKFQKEAKRNSSGIAQLNMSTVWLGNHHVPIYSLKKQKSIVATLDKINELIDANKRQLELLDEAVKSRFVEMFGDLSESIRLGDCCEVHARIGWQALTKAEHMQTGDYLLITGTDFKDNEIDYSSCVYVAKERYEMDRHIILKNDDILITKDGTIGKVAIIHNLPKPATLNSGVFVVRPNNKFNKEYIAYVFKGSLFGEYVDKSKTGATIKHLNQKHLVEFNIPMPSMEAQIKFAEFAQQSSDIKFGIQKHINLFYELLKNKMDEYFGGESDA